MNYLAHLFLSGDREGAILGGLLGDFVKGSAAGRFSPAIADAILLHRKIDSFSDAHRVTRKSRDRISPSRRRFAGIIIDVGYDHFLSRHWGDFAGIDLASFVGRVYAVLIKNRALLPDRLNRILPHMISENWLGSYVRLKEVGGALDRIAQRLSRASAFLGAVTEIEANYRALESDFLGFFPDLTDFCAEWKHRCKNGAAKISPPNQQGSVEYRGAEEVGT